MVSTNDSKTGSGGTLAIFQIGAFFPTARGATYSAYRLALALRKRGVTVKWVVPGLDGTRLAGDHYDGFEVYAFAIPNRPRIRRWINFGTMLQWYGRNAARISIVHIHGGGLTNLLTIGLLKILIPKTPVLLKMTLDGWDTPDGIKSGRHGWLLSRCFQRADAVVAMTSGQHNKLAAHGYRGLTNVIPNGVDTEIYAPDPENRVTLRSKLGIPEDAIVLSYVGAIGRRKRPDVILRLWEILTRNRDNIHILFIGDFVKDRDQNAYIAAYLRELGIREDILSDPRIHRTGTVTDAERYLQASDIFVFPSRQEGFGTVQIEAMACGLPCVVNDLPGVSADIFPDESVGFRVKDNDLDEYVRICRLLIDDPELRQRVGAAARARVISQFSIETVSERYLDLYAQLIGARGSNASCVSND